MAKNDYSRRKYLTAVGAVGLAGVAGCSGNSSGDSNETDESTTEPTSGLSSTATMSPKEVMRQFLQSLAAGDSETVRQLTAEEYSGETTNEANLTIESMEQYSAEEYAEREGNLVSAVEDNLATAEDLGYDDSTIVSYTASTEEVDRIQRDALLVLDGEQWLVLKSLA
jgi:hypothetical protein